MRIKLKKFGTLLTSRQDGREALAAINSQLQNSAPGEKIEIDFTGVITFAPSWADEFITNIIAQFGKRVILEHTDNPSVRTTLELLEKVGSGKFIGT
ncbi:STAS-like domain-containing protein [Patescibacteria group bacterium]|nr:STAS-like domain-containing protein [Patescibacteria group bacterium]